MNTFINSGLPYLDNLSLPPVFLSDTTKRYTKITAVALVILSALTTLFFIYRWYKAENTEPNENEIPPYQSPKPVHNSPKPNQPVTPHVQQRPIYSFSPASSPIPPKKLAFSPQPSPRSMEQDDFEIARQMEAEWAAEEAEENEKKAAQALKASLATQPILNPKPVIPTATLTPPFTPKTAPVPPSSPAPQNIAVEHPTPIDPEPEEQAQQQLGPSPFEEINTICKELEESINPPVSIAATFAAINPNTQRYALKLFNELVEEYEKRNPYIRKHVYGQPVDQYFANVKNESTEERLYRSLVGIRNLFMYGPQIMDDFRRTQYLGGDVNYNFNAGLNALRAFTGTVVDLDIEISAKSDADALRQAEEHIVAFGKLCGLKKWNGEELTAQDVANMLPHRKLHLPHDPNDIYLSNSNVDRSHCGLWKRVNPKTYQVNYFVNVPNFNLVIVAMLKLPYMMAELTHYSKEHNQGTLPIEYFDEFFSKGLSDMCFNDKARTFLDFSFMWMAKLEGKLLSPEEDATRKINKGVFGEALRLKGAKTVLREAYTKGSLSTFCSNLDDSVCSAQGRTMDQWLEDEKETIIEALKENGIWEAALYHTDEKGDFFLLNESTLNLFLKSYFNDYVQYM